MTRPGARPTTRSRGTRTRVVVPVLTLVLLTGCTGAEPRGATFVLPPGDVVACQEHQPVGPSAAYAGDADSDTVAMLDLLRYWTENGDKPYCDGEPPTDIDLEWRETAQRLQGR